VRSEDAGRARDAGANFVLTKPIAPNLLLQRIMWIGRDARPFVELESYVGPDRRFSLDGPPDGAPDRRAGGA
jgi:DNA-binding response OmpR family regulator